MAEPGHNLSDQHDTRVPPGCGHYLTIASVRNPYARAVSLWHHRARVFPGTPGAASFAEFVANIGHYDDPFFDWPLAGWFPRGQRLDCLIRQETLEADVRALGLADGPFEVPRENCAHAGCWQFHYRHAPGALERVREWEAESFERFGYSQ
jgi:hypothetical protein